MENYKEPVTSHVEFITPELATKYLMYNENNRPLSNAHVKYLKSQMEKGNWVLNGEAIVFDDDGNLANGQHRLVALSRAEIKGIYTLVVRGVKKNTFATFDQGRNRSYRDIFALDGIPNAVLMSSITNRYYALHCAKLALIGHTTTKAGYKDEEKLSKQELLDVYKQSSDVFREAAKLAGRAECQGVKVLTKVESAALAAYFIIDLCWDWETVEDFLIQLFTGRSKFECVETLHKKLANSLISKNTKMTGTYRTNLIAKAWNAFVTGKDIKRLNWREEEGKIGFRTSDEVNNHLNLSN